MQNWIAAQTVLRLGERVKAKSKEGHSLTGEVIALTPSAARIKLPDGRLARLPAVPTLEDKIFRLAIS